MSDSQALKDPWVGIALAAYQPDPQSFLAQIHSIRDQTFRNWVGVVTCDSPLPDALVQELRSDSRWKVVTNASQLGVVKNFEKAAREVSTQQGVRWVAFSDQDDHWDSNKLERMVQVAQTLPPFSMVHCDARVKRGSQLEAPSMWKAESRNVTHLGLSDLLIRNVVTGASMLFDVEIVRKASAFPEAADFHDHWVALLALAAGGEIYPLPEVLYSYQQHAGNVVGVAAHTGVFSNPKGRNRTEIFERCRMHRRKTQELALALSKETGKKIAEPCYWVEAFKAMIRGDGPLVRASLVRGLGKLF